MGVFSTTIGKWVAETNERGTLVFRQSAQELFERAQENAPHRDGFLKASLVVGVDTEVPPATRDKPEGQASFAPPNISAVIATAQLGQTISGGWTARYAPAQEWGAGPHVIEPKNKLALHWRNAGGEGVFATRVNHPGNPPTAFVRRAVAQWPQIVSSVAARARSRAGR